VAARVGAFVDVVVEHVQCGFDNKQTNSWPRSAGSFSAGNLPTNGVPILATHRFVDRGLPVCLFASVSDRTRISLETVHESAQLLNATSPCYCRAEDRDGTLAPLAGLVKLVGFPAGALPGPMPIMSLLALRPFWKSWCDLFDYWSFFTRTLAFVLVPRDGFRYLDRACPEEFSPYSPWYARILFASAFVSVAQDPVR